MPLIYSTCSLHKLLAVTCFTYSCTAADRIIGKCTYFFRLSNVTFLRPDRGWSGKDTCFNRTEILLFFVPFIPEYNFRDEVVAIRCSRYDLLRWKRNIIKY